MSKTKFQFYLCAEAADKEGKTTAVFLKRVRLQGEETWYSFPESHQKTSGHETRMALAPLKNAQAALRTRGQFRTVNISLDDSQKKLYMDDEGNFTFKDYPLAESKIVSAQSTPHEAKMEELVSSFSKAVLGKEESIKEVIEHFLIKKLYPKNKNVASWCELFEKESARFQLSGQRQIEIFKSCLDPSLEDWFLVNQRRLANSADWTEWKAKLIGTFGNNSFKPVYQVFSYKYLYGSYIEYVIRKKNYFSNSIAS